MQFTGQIKSVSKDFATDDLLITLSVNEKATILPEYEKIRDYEKLSVEIKKYRNKRSHDANKYLWALLQKMAELLKTDKWSLYLKMLRQYGSFTYIVVKPNVVDAVKAQWRECEVTGDIEVNGVAAVQMICYFGSSTYDTAQMAHLIDMVVEECKELGIETLPPIELQMMKERWGV